MSNIYGSFGPASSEPEIDAASSARSVKMGENDMSTSSQGTVYGSGGGHSPAHMVECQPPKSQRNRRRTVPGPDHVKHRRTRSGCYTCRSRRVKCDETHPICNRCRKGQRECTYPETSPPNLRNPELPASRKDSPTSSNEYEDDASPETRLPTRPGEDEGSASGSRESRPPRRTLRRINTTSSLSMRRAITDTRDVSETPSQDGSMSEDRSLGVTPILHLMQDQTLGTKSKPDWSHLAPDLRFYLDYYCEHITHWKYGVHKDPDDVFHTTFISFALQSEPLLYALVSFAAFKRMLNNPEGKIHDFLQYYTPSVTLLLGLLQNHETKHDVPTLLTILQLATMEEYLGDFANLVGHQKAAFEFLTQLFTPKTMVQTSLGRVIHRWYTRLDLIVATMGFAKPSLPRRWLAECVSYQERASYGSDLTSACDRAQAQLGLLSMDMCLLNARIKSGEGTKEELTAEHIQLTIGLREWRDNLHPGLADPANLVSSASLDSPMSPRLFNYFPDHVPLFVEPFCFATANVCEWHSIVLMHTTQAEQAGDVLAVAEAKAQLGDDAAAHAVAICEIIDAAGRWPLVPKGMLMMMHPVLGVAAMFLERSTRNHMWLREKLAWLESCGYIFPYTMRSRLAYLFGDETVVHWWLPHQEGFTPVLQSVRAFTDERSNNPASAQNRHSQNMKKVFDSFVNLRLQNPRVDTPKEE